MQIIQMLTVESSVGLSRQFWAWSGEDLAKLGYQANSGKGKRSHKKSAPTTSEAATKPASEAKGLTLLESYRAQRDDADCLLSAGGDGTQHTWSGCGDGATPVIRACAEQRAARIESIWNFRDVDLARLIRVAEAQ
jgi:hypothetical protein